MIKKSIKSRNSPLAIICHILSEIEGILENISEEAPDFNKYQQRRAELLSRAYSEIARQGKCPESVVYRAPGFSQAIPVSYFLRNVSEAANYPLPWVSCNSPADTHLNPKSRY